ncbi:hypothetical protein KY346_06200 [Candidatus Woesearchaeota archaeon]|nr:hypothetical protein [Candidatus Woesearchaeota archaeon]
MGKSDKKNLEILAEERFNEDPMIIDSAEKIASRYRKRKTVSFAILCVGDCPLSGRKAYFIEYKDTKDGQDKRQCIEWQNRQKNPCPYKDKCELSQPQVVEE